MSDNPEIEVIARIIDPEAFGLPAHKPCDGSDYLSDRDEARDKALAILRFQRTAEAYPLLSP